MKKILMIFGMMMLMMSVASAYMNTVYSDEMTNTGYILNEAFVGTGDITDIFDFDDNTYMSFTWDDAASSSSGVFVEFRAPVDSSINNDGSAYILVKYFISESCSLPGHTASIVVGANDGDFNEQLPETQYNSFPISTDATYNETFNYGGGFTHTQWAIDNGYYQVTIILGDTDGPVPVDGCLEMGIYDVSVVYTSDTYEKPPRVSNTAPVINSISPANAVELKSGDSQVFSADVTDDEDDANYTWTLGGVEVSTSETYNACWDDIAAGIYTLQLEVADAEYSDTASTTLEIRARGGAPSGGSSDDRQAPEDAGAVEKIQPQQQSKIRVFFRNIGDSIGNFFRNIFGRG